MAHSSRPMRTHTHQEFEAELRNLKDRLLAMGGRCEQMISTAVRAFEDRDEALAREVIEADRRMDEDEVIVDELAVRMLALRQPVGRDLRFAVAAVKASTDLERIGDEAVNIAERAMEMEPTDRLSPPESKLPEMAQRAGAMLRDSLNALVEEDPKKARIVFEQDDAVDAIYGEVMQLSIDYMKDPSRIADGMRICNCAKYLERIADHATNIAEMVIFTVEGRDVRHGNV
ncbi:MAG: phosphate signaling complex protein PhoU [Deltaproteobacteria bacterium]|nr:phosphate signaling complex protein PhoU [Deltaproteobacteria bacterium]MBW2586913.1 phosphate signaling complex protein PhoU [Deltaproteobacteria bacterium]